jgi:MFS family permease
MLPYLLFSMAAGAIADSYDRRKVALSMVGCACISASLLATVAALGWLTPTLLLVISFCVGTANAMFGPAWQASVSEQVPAAELPAAVALNSISYNIARSFGPAIGGFIVAAAGATGAFAANAVCYLPILLAMYLWRRIPEPPRLPPERISWAIVSGIRYIVHSAPMRVVIIRAGCIGLAGGAISSLMPLVARDMLDGGAATYGILLGAFGIGAVAGALLIGPIGRVLSSEAQVNLATLVGGIGIVVLSFSQSEIVAIPALIVIGIAWMQILTTFNVAIQTMAPRWVAGRALAAYMAATAGGIAMGSWIWGTVGQHVGTAASLGISGIAFAGCVLLALRWRMRVDGIDISGREPLAEPEAALAVSGRSGPIVIEVEYTVAPDRARAFYNAMLDVGSVRQRNGAYNWTLLRDVASETIWIERYNCPTWHDYLRQRNRMTEGEYGAFALAINETASGEEPPVRRLLERPLGSVRWQSLSRDPGFTTTIGP